MKNEYLKKYKIINAGCDDVTEGVFELSEEQYEFLDKLFNKLNDNSYYSCMPSIYIEKYVSYKGGADNGNER